MLRLNTSCFCKVLIKFPCDTAATLVLNILLVVSISLAISDFDLERPGLSPCKQFIIRKQAD